MEKFPFSYLGIRLGGNFQNKTFWDPMFGKVRNKVDKWRIVLFRRVVG